MPGQNNEKETKFRQAFPDENFRKYLNSIGIKADNWENEVILEKYSTLNLSGYPSIADLTGIERFTKLNSLTISRNTKLLDLDLSGNRKLTTVVCNQNKELRKISLPSSVTSLTCDYNENLFSLDLTGLNVLTTLSCKNQNQKGLMSLILPSPSKLTAIDCSGNGLTSIGNLDSQTKLLTFICSNNRLTSLTVPSALTKLNCSNNQLKTLDLSSASQLTNLVVGPQTVPCLDDNGKVNFNSLGITNADATSYIKSISGVTTDSKLPHLTAADPAKGVTYLYRTKGTADDKNLMTVNLVRKNSAVDPILPEPIPANGTVMKRLYNPNSGEHFYTSSQEEASDLVSKGWNPEGNGWTAPVSSNTPVYRLYNPIAGDHHYTVDLNERDTLVTMGWKDEGIGWYSADASGVPVYRQYNPNAKAGGAHNHTVDANEANYLVGNGWKDEGIAWYGMK